MLGFDGEFATVIPIAIFCRFLLKGWKKLALKHSNGN